MKRIVRSLALSLTIAGSLADARGGSLRGTVLRERFRAEPLREPLRYELYLPPGHPDGAGLPYQVFLPGFKDRETYCRRKGFFRIAEGMIDRGLIPPMAIVCVGRGHGFWIDAYSETTAYETALVRDLLGRLETVHKLSPDRAGRGILGISFGGYAAIKISLRHPDLFGSVSALSPALDPQYEERVRARQAPWQWGGERARRRMYGPGFDLDRALAEDPFWLVKNAKESIRTPYYLTCGLEDRHRLAGPLAAFRNLLITSGGVVTGDLVAGNHDARFWRRVYTAALLFHASHFSRH